MKHGGSTAWRGLVSPENRKLAIALVVLLAIVFVFVFSNVAVNHAPKPHDVPVGIVGSPQTADALARQLESSAPGAFDVTAYSSSEAARTAILHRKIYGAFEPGPPPVLLAASAASVPVEQILEATFGAATRKQGQTLTVHDVAPLPSSDASGGTSFSAVLSLIIAGIVGSAIIYMITEHRSVWVRLGALVVLAVGSGLLAALATNVVVGAFSGHFLAVWGLATLFVLALAMPIAAFQVLFGLPGTAVGFLVFILLGDPSAGGSAPELLPGFWRAISQHLPPGAGITAMRNVVYFHGHGATRAIIVLSVYAAVGAVGAIAADRFRAHRRPPVASAPA